MSWGPDNNLINKSIQIYQELKSNMPYLIYVSKNSKMMITQLFAWNKYRTKCGEFEEVINSNAVVCHDTIVEDHVHITPNTTITWSAKIGRYYNQYYTSVYFQLRL